MLMLHQTARREAGVKLIALAREATRAVDALLGDAKAAVRARVTVENHTVDRLFDREQRATHGLAWLATYVEAVQQLAAYAERMHDAGTLGEIEELKRTGVIDKGMIPKMDSAVAAICSGVDKVSLVDGRVPHSVLMEIFTDAGVGTELVK
jgi:hypothetical protein